MKDISSLVTVGSMKRDVNANMLLVFVDAKAKDPCPNDEVLEMGQSSQWGGNKPQAFHTFEGNIGGASVLALPSLQHPFKIDTMRIDMLSSPSIFAPIVLKNASLAHVEEIDNDQVFKDVCPRIIHGMHVKTFCL